MLLLMVTTWALNTHAQPVAKIDAVGLINELPAPPKTLLETYQRTYPNNASTADAKPYYQATFDKLQRASESGQQLAMKFYQENPTGVPKMPQQPTNRVSEKDKSAMEAATSELAQKMLTDKAFAQKFAQMSESEQHAYMAKMLADKGLKPVHGAPNAPVAAMPGMDIDWMTLCTQFTQTAYGLQRWERQTALQQQYSVQHDAVNAWVEAEIKKLPMISFGEYGHDHDPEKVKAIKKQGLEKHRQVADAMMKEAAEMFAQFRQEAKNRCTPLNDALKKVNYGEAYSFGLNYSLVLQVQLTILGDVDNLLTNEINLIEDVAQWEHEWGRFE